MSRVSGLGLTVLFFFVSTALAQGLTGAKRRSYSVGTVEVKYVAGTEEEGILAGMGKMGCLQTTNDSLVFRSYSEQSLLWRGRSRLVHLVNPAWSKGHCSGDKPEGKPGASETIIEIPYRDIRALARGQVLSGTASGGGGAPQLATLVGGLGGLVAAVEKLSGPALSISIAVTGTMIVVGQASYLNRKTLNYIAIFYRNQEPVALRPLTLNPSSMPGGSSSTGTVTLSGPAPASGAVVYLTTSNPQMAKVPSCVTVPENSATATFSITNEVPPSMAATITVSAAYNGSSQTATLAIGPPFAVSMLLPPPPTQPATGPENADPFSECQHGGCRVVVFQVVDSHDFWNTVELLSGKAGRQFMLEETAAQAQPKPSK